MSCLLSEYFFNASLFQTSADGNTLKPEKLFHRSQLSILETARDTMHSLIESQRLWHRLKCRQM